MTTELSALLAATRAQIETAEKALLGLTEAIPLSEELKVLTEKAVATKKSLLTYQCNLLFNLVRASIAAGRPTIYLCEINRTYRFEIGNCYTTILETMGPAIAQTARETTRYSDLDEFVEWLNANASGSFGSVCDQLMNNALGMVRGTATDAEKFASVAESIENAIFEARTIGTK